MFMRMIADSSNTSRLNLVLKSVFTAPRECAVQVGNLDMAGEWEMGGFPDAQGKSQLVQKGQKSE